MLVVNTSGQHDFNAGLIKSVTPFSITIGTGQASNTATIAAVGSMATIIQHGFTTNATTTSPDKFMPRVDLTNSTTVTATRNASDATITITVKGVVIEWLPSAVKSVQQGTITLTGVASNTATITSVTTTNSGVHYLGNTTNDATAAYQRYFGRVALTDATTVTCTKDTATSNITAGYVVLEFNSGILNSATQQGSVQVTVTTATATITGITTGQTMLLWGGRITSSPNDNDSKIGWLDLTNTTTVTHTRVTATNDSTSNFTVLEFKAAQITLIQRGTGVIATTQTIKDTTITSVDTTKSFANYLGFGTSGASASADKAFSTVELQAATNLRTTRATADATLTATSSYEVIAVK